MDREAPVAPRKKPRQARARATVDAILIAAAHSLKTEGFEHATTNRIAELAGVSIGSLYQYFPNKVSIVGALRERHSDWFKGASSRFAPSKPWSTARPSTSRSGSPTHTLRKK